MLQQHCEDWAMQGRGLARRPLCRGNAGSARAAEVEHDLLEESQKNGLALTVRFYLLVQVFDQFPEACPGLLVDGVSVHHRLLLCLWLRPLGPWAVPLWGWRVIPSVLLRVLSTSPYWLNRPRILGQA